MAVIQHTTLRPTKLELLASWLPARPWYRGAGQEPRLAKAGGFRIDDPDGAVGIEFMAVTDAHGDRAVTYQVPLSYRGAPLDGAEHALIGTSEHGVLGRRWIYDGTHDPVLVAQLFALLLGAAEPQDQNTSDTPDPSVTASFAAPGSTASIVPVDVSDGPHGTDLRVRAASRTDQDRAAGHLTLHISRVLEPHGDAPAPALGHVTAGWALPDGTTARGPYVVVRGAGSDGTTV